DGKTSNGVSFTFEPPAPILSSIAPNPALAGSTVEIVGENFQAGLTVLFGASASGGVTFVSATRAQAVVPAGSGDVVATVRNVDDKVSNGVSFTYEPPAPILASVTPNFALVGTTVQLSGDHFAPGLTVRFGSAPASGVVYVDAQNARAVVPAGNGTVDVQVENADGKVSSAASFTYEPPAPILTALSPDEALVGETIELQGDSFRAGLAVFFGATPASTVTFVNATRAQAVVPVGTGSVDVRVENDDGKTSGTVAFTYENPAPTLDTVNPSNAVAGAVVDLNGSGFLAGLTVRFGAAASPTVTWIDESRATAEVPAGVGTVDVVVENVDGKTSNTASFTYEFPAPVLTSIEPQSGKPGDTIELAGANFRDGLTVSFAGEEAPSIEFVSDSLVRAEVPSGSGVAQVTVTNPDGKSSESRVFAYLEEAPSIDRLDPEVGDAGDSILIVGGFFQATAVVLFGETLSPSVTVLSANTIQAEVPQGDGEISVIVRNTDGQESNPVSFLYRIPAQFLRGDANLDEDVDLSDAVRILIYLFGGGEAQCLDAADSDDSGDVDLTDAIFVLNYLFQGGLEPSAPFPALGVDPTPDEIGCDI
ncbi:MAG: IPT/TIG domain-containing protein, partial [Planctomycetota bacterium]